MCAVVWFYFPFFALIRQAKLFSVKLIVGYHILSYSELYFYFLMDVILNS